MSVLIITPDELKTFVGKQTNESDFAFREFCESATVDFEDYIGQNVVQAGVVWEFDGDDSQWVKLPASWATAITLLESRSMLSMSDADWVTVAASSYQLSVRGQLCAIRSAAVLPSSLMYRVTFVNGMVLVPENIKRACCFIGAKYFYNSNLPGGEHLLMFASLSRTYGQAGAASDSIKSCEDLDRMWQAIADKYRLQVM